MLSCGFLPGLKLSLSESLAQFGFVYIYLATVWDRLSPLMNRPAWSVAVTSQIWARCNPGEICIFTPTQSFSHGWRELVSGGERRSFINAACFAGSRVLPLCRLGDSQFLCTRSVNCWYLKGAVANQWLCCACQPIPCSVQRRLSAHKVFGTRPMRVAKNNTSR